MTRKEFLRMCSILGVGFPLMSTISSCDDTIALPQGGKVLIIGAGAAGLAAGHLLAEQNIEFEILEASSNYGGRMKTNTDFAEFPIPLGAEWLHMGTSIFNEIVNDINVSVNVPTTPYDPNTDFGLYNGQQVSVAEIGFDIDRKFIGGTWLTFFEQYIVPSVLDKITFNEVVQNIDYSADQVIVQTQTGQKTADKVIVTVPVKILQEGDVTFTPALPNNKREAINDVTVWDGFKAFFEFSDTFYPALIGFDVVPDSAGQKLFYDAAYGQNSNTSVLGIFTVGSAAQTYANLSDEDFKNQVLAELDGLFNNQASAKYIKHTTQNWNAEPFAKGAYIFDHEDWRNMEPLSESVDSKVYFAGDGYGFSDDWSSVHVAARSAKRAVEELVG